MRRRCRVVLSFQAHQPLSMAAAVAAVCDAARVAAAAGNESTSSAAASMRALLLPADRATRWQPGMMGAGGIPARSTVCSTLTPSGGTTDDTARIQAAINVCPVGQVVQLSAGTFLINDGHYLRVNKGITLRGAGPGQDHCRQDQRCQAVPVGGQRQAVTAHRRRHRRCFPPPTTASNAVGFGRA